MSFFLGARSQVTYGAALVGVAAVASVFLFMQTSYATVNSNVANGLVVNGQTIKASSSPTAVLGLNLAVDGGETLVSLKVMLSGSGGFATSTDLTPFGVATSSGLALYRDNKSGGITGTFDNTDTVLLLMGAPTSTGATTTLTLNIPEPVPANDTGANTGNDFFLVVTTAVGAVNAHAFTMTIYPGEVYYSANSPTATPVLTTTQSLVVDTTLPTVSGSGPPTASTNVPINAFINVNFSENIDPTTVNPATVALTAAGSPAGIGFQVFPNGFNVIVSDPPTYAASSRFAKVPTTTYAFLMIMGTNPIMPQGGTYTVPAAGDIVYFQHDTFPSELGIVTNSTLTGGTFAVNNFTLMGGQTLVKFASPTATGAVSAATVPIAGDLIVVNSTSSPTSDRYAWHIVRVGAAINGAAIRLDDATTNPGYVSGSSFSTFRPTATSTINASAQLVSGMVLNVGDMVFAKVTAGGDNLNTFAWHLVTNAETVGVGAAPNVLQLDGAAASTTFAASTEIAKLIPGAQGAATENATSFSFGDIVLAKTTANASNNGAYNFHLVSGQATGANSTSLRFDNSSSNLLTSTSYSLSVGPGVKDKAGNGLAASTTITFTTGSTGGTNTTPPFVQSSIPQPGNQSFSPNAALRLGFSVDMALTGAGSATSSTNIGLFLDNFGAAGSAVTTVNTYDTTTKSITITPSSALTPSTGYILRALPATQSATGATLGNEYRLYFRTASTTDTTAPTILGLSPASSTTGVSRSVIVSAGFSEDMDASTLTGSTVTLKRTSDNAAVSGSVGYNPMSRSVAFAPSTAQLDASTQYMFTITTGAKDLANNALAANYTPTFTTDGATDSTLPSISFANADNFSMAVTFTETMKSGGGPNAADNISNYTLESPPGSSISLGGKTVTYDAAARTARINGVSLQNGSQFKIIVGALVQDLANNGMDTTGSPAKNTSFGTVANASQTGGALGPGQGTMNFSQQGMNPIRVFPMSKAAGATSGYHVEFLASTSVPLGGQIMLTFPSGFNLTSATGTATTTSFCNLDINGPASGTTTIASVIADNGAGTVTITTAGSATGNNAFICLDLANIVNSTLPNSSGYNIDIKTKDTAGNNRTILETKTASPFFLGAVGSRTLTVNVFNDADASGVKDNNEGIANATVFVFSPQSGGQEATTTAGASGGVATFTSLSDGDYMVGVKPGTVGNVAFNSAPQPVNVTANTTKNFALVAAPYTIAGTVTGPSGTKVDVFASSQTGFSKTTLTLTGGADAYTLPAASSTTYRVGVGPSIPETFSTPGAPPPPMPTFNFMPPAPITVSVVSANATGKNFVLAATSKMITGTVLDSSGGAVSNTGVFCRPVQDSSFAATSSVGFGSGAMTDTAGAFTVNITPGVYLCGAFKPGMPPVSDKQITVPTTGANTPATLAFTLGAGTTLTISGTVKDDSGNAVAYSGVNARKVTSTGDTTPLGGGAQNFVGGPTDANGAYTLYVTNGTWAIDAFAPGFGQLTSKTVTVAGTSLTGQDFSAQTMSLGTITGSTTQANIAAQGVMVRADSSTGSNMAVSDTFGSYSIKVPAGTYSIKCFFPGTGDGTPVTGITVTSNTTTSGQNCTVATPITVTVNLTDGTNAIQNAFVDARDSNGRGNNTSQSTVSGVNAVYTLVLPPGTYTVRAGHPAYGQIGTAGSATTTQTLTMTATAGSLFAMTGTVLASSLPVNGAWVSFTGVPTGQSNVINIGTQTAADGTFTLNAPAGSYRLRADKPGYKSGTETNVTVTAAAALGTITLTTASRTITGTVTISGAGVANAFVSATDGAGGFAVSQTDASGAYSLAIDSGTWTLQARSMGYNGSLSGVVVGGSNVSGQTITLTAISGFTMTEEKQETVTPTSGGLLSNSDIGSAFKLNIPANALGTGSNAGTVKTQINTAVPSPVTGTVLANNAISISAVDSAGSPIKNLNTPVTVVVPYTDTGLTAAQESNLTLGVWNDAAQSYDVLSATVDTSANTLTAAVSHFSDFAPLSSEGVAAPSPSPSPSPTPAPSGGGSAIPISLLNPGSTPVATTPASVPVSAEAPQTTTSAPVAAVASVSGPVLTKTLKIGSKDEEVKLLQQYLIAQGFLVMPSGVSLGYFGQVTRTALQAYQTSVGLSAVGELGPKTRAAILSGGHAQAAPTGKAIGLYNFTLPLRSGSKGTDVTKLQEILIAKGFLIMPAHVSKGYYGALTVKAVKEYQKSLGIDQLGIVGPATRKALNTP
jgi:hypothetical protein